jgi:hypothetical protein
MSTSTQPALLDFCWSNMESGRLDTVAEGALRRWWKLERARRSARKSARLPPCS